MSEKDRKFIKTKFEGVFYRTSARRDPRTGEMDRVYYFWWADADGVLRQLYLPGREMRNIAEY